MEANDELVTTLMPTAAGSAPAGVQSSGSLWQFEYVKRRPMHSGRFIAFVKEHFGPLEDDELLKAGAETPGSGGWCSRRRRPGDASEMATFERLPAPGPLLDVETEEGKARLGCHVLSVSGCVWFALSDDCKVEWRFEAASSSSAPAASVARTESEGDAAAPLVERPRRRGDRHRLRRGAPWQQGDPCRQNEAGDRCVDLRFELRDSTSSAHAAHDTEASLRQGLDACLLRRDEAMLLDAFSTVEGLDAWETRVQRLRRRRDGAGRVTAGEDFAEMSGTLGVLDMAVRVVSALPGYARAAALGEAMTRRVSKALGASGHPGHADAGEERNDVPPMSVQSSVAAE